MSLGENLFDIRRKNGYSQEDIAEKLGVTRQTVSKWETGETVPDIYQAKKMAQIYKISLDELLEFDVKVKQIEEMIEKTDEKTQQKIDWNKMWGKKYPVLLEYKNRVDIQPYAENLSNMLTQLKQQYGYNHQDAMLVLKDILAQVWKNTK